MIAEASHLAQPSRPVRIERLENKLDLAASNLSFGQPVLHLSCLRVSL